MSAEPFTPDELAEWRRIGDSGSAAGEMAGEDLRRMFATLDEALDDVWNLTDAIERVIATYDEFPVNSTVFLASLQGLGLALAQKKVVTS